MALNFGGNLFPPSQKFLGSFDFVDIIRGRAYITFYCVNANVKSTIYESYTTGDDATQSLSNGANDWGAQTFTVGNTGTNEDFWVSGIEYYGQAYDDVSQQYIFAIQAISGGEPDGTDIAYGMVKEKGIVSGSDEWNRIKFTKPAKLSASTQYALIIRGNFNSFLKWRYDGSSPSYAGGQHFVSADSGANWTGSSAKDYLFKILGDTVNPLTFSQVASTNTSIFLKYIRTFGRTYTQQFTQDIEMELGQSAIINSTAFINLPFTLINSGGANTLGYYYNLELLRNRAGSETSMGTSSTGAVTTSSTSEIMSEAQIEISENVFFRKDDKLILRITFFLKASSNANDVQYEINFNNIILKLPFKLDT